MTAPETFTAESVARFIEEQAALGLQLWLENGALRFKAPQSVLTPGLISVLKANKQTIIDFLSQQDDSPEKAVIELESFPLSYSQSAIWMLYRFAPENPAYNTAFIARLSQDVKAEVLKQTYLNVLLRHPMLRSTFADTEQGPRQTVHRSLPVNFIEQDASAWSEAELSRWINQEADRPFDLAVESPLRVAVVRTASETLLVASVHHIATDLWGLVLIAADIQRDYAALSKGELVTVTAPKHQYREHVEWQQRVLAGANGQTMADYWLNALRGAPMKLDLPIDFARPAIMSMRGDKEVSLLSAAVAEQARQFCKKEGITAFVLFQSVFQLLVHALTGRHQFLVGTPTVGRSAPGMEEVVGDFANPVVLRAELNDALSISELLQRVKRNLFGALNHQDYPFPLLIQQLNPPRDASRTPVFQLMFLWHQGNPGAAFKQGLLEAILPESGPRGTPYDLMLAVSDLGDGFELNWHYATALFKAESIVRFANAFEYLLQRILQQPEQRLPRICLEVAECLAEKYALAPQGYGVTASIHAKLNLLLPSHSWCLIRAAGAENRFVLFVESNQYLETDAFIQEIPELIAVQSLPRLPRTGCGDIDRDTLAQLPYLNQCTVAQWQKELCSQLQVQDSFIGLNATPHANTWLHETDCINKDWLSGEVSGYTASNKAVSNPLTQAELEQRPMAYSNGGELLVPESAPRTLCEALIRAASVSAEKGLLFIEADGQVSSKLTYASLLQQAQNVATALQQQGFVAGQMVMLQVENPAQYFQLFWGCVWLGVTPITISPATRYQMADPVARKLINVWEKQQNPSMIISAALVQPITRLAEAETGKQLEYWVAEELVTAVQKARLAPYAGADDTVFLQLTSGSTGVPKCIQESHRSIISHAQGVTQYNGYSPADVTLNWLPYDHVVPIITTHFKDVYLGCEQIQIRTAYILEQPLRWLQLMSKYKVTHSWSPNFGFNLILDQVTQSQLEGIDLSALQYMMNAGEQVTPRVVRQFCSYLAKTGIKPTVMQPAFGMAESSTCITYVNEQVLNRVLNTALTDQANTLRVATDDLSSSTAFVDLGAVIPGVEIRITDTQNNLVREGVIGRLQIRGTVVTQGYLNNPAANEEAFVGEGWFNSGDLGFIWQGRLVLTGREKEMIIVRGSNYYCHEIEDIVSSISGVEATFVAAFAALQASGDEALVLAYVRAQESAELDCTQLEKNILAEVSRQIGLEPRCLIAVEKSQFYKTTSGKIQRGQFKALFESGAYVQQIKQFDLRHQNAHALQDWFYSRVDVCKTLDKASGNNCAVVNAAVFANEAHRAQVLRADAGWMKSGIITSHTELYQLDQLLALDVIAQADYLAETHLHSPSAKLAFIYQEQANESALSLCQHAADWLMRIRELLVSLMAKAGNQGTILLLASAKNTHFIHLFQSFVDSLNSESASVRIRAISFASDAYAVFGKEMENTPTDDSAVHLNNQGRWISALRKQPLTTQVSSVLDSNQLPLKFDGRYWVTGGLGGIGFLLVKHLLQHFNCSLMISGSTSLESSQELLEKFESLQASLKPGQTCNYVVLDLNKPETIAVNIKSTLRDNGIHSLDGIFHLAGRLIPALFSQMNMQQFEQTVQPKVAATIALALSLRELNSAGSFIQFSSLNAFFGGVNASAYAFANAVQFEIADALRKSGLEKSYCLAWSQWRNRGISSHLSSVETRLAERQGFIPVNEAAGMNSLLALLNRQPASTFIGLDASATNIFRNTDPRDSIHSLAWNLTAVLEAESATGTSNLSGKLALAGLVENRSAVKISPATALSQLPRDAAGKIHADVLFNADAGAMTAQLDSRAFTATEQQLALIWQSVLGNQVQSPSSDFFSAGGHSLNAVQVISRINQSLQLNMSLAELFTHPTLEAFAKRIDQLQQGLVNHAPIPRDLTSPPQVTPAQERLWFIQKFTQLPSLWNVPIALELNGEINTDAMKKAMMDVLERHPSLRVGYSDQTSGVLEVKELQVTELPFRQTVLVGEWDENRVEQQADHEALLPFDLNQQMPLRAHLISFSGTARRHLLLITTHHLVSDGWSIGLLLKEVALGYAAHANGLKVLGAMLPSQPISYFDYAHWYKQQLAASVYQDQLDYWVKKLAGMHGSLELPTDFERPAQQTFFGDEHYFQLDSAKFEQLREFASARQATPFMVLLAVFQLLLARYSGQKDICVGTPVANRPRPELEDCIGLFINTVVIRNEIDENNSFNELLQQVKTASLEAFSNQNISFEHVVEAIKPERSASHSPLFQVMFIYQNVPLKVFGVTGMNVTPRVRKSRLSKYDLSLQCFEYDGELRMSLEYARALFTAARIERMSTHYLLLLDQILSNADCLKSPVHQLAWMTKQDADTVTASVQVTNSSEFNSGKKVNTVVAQFNQVVNSYPHRNALTEEGGITTTYAALGARVNQIAYALKLEGIQKGQTVAVSCLRTADLVASLLAVMKIGAIYVPIEPNFPDQRVSDILEQSHAALLITDSELAQRYAYCLPPLLNVSLIDKTSSVDLHSDALVELSDSAYIMFTSGSTGKPKGVEIGHAALAGFLEAMQHSVQWPAQWTLLAITSISFDISLLELLLPLISGNQLVMGRGDAIKTGEGLLAWLNTYKVNALQATPATWKLLSESDFAVATEPFIGLCGGEALMPDLATNIVAKGVQLYNVYGPTETTIWSSIYQVNGSAGRLSIGKPLENEFFILLDQHNNPVPPGIKGRLFIGGLGLAKGYFSDTEKTADKFIYANKNVQQLIGPQRLYDTGDTAMLASDGNYVYYGRQDDQVKIRGFRIELLEVERAIASLPGVKSAAVIVDTDPIGQKRLAAFVGQMSNQRFDVNVFRNSLKPLLPDYMIPTLWFEAKEMPLNNNGKIDRSALRRLLPELMAHQIVAECTAPRDVLEQALFDIWAHCLGHKSFGVEDDFFSVGGHSLLAVQVLARINKQFQVELPITAWMHQLSIAALAETIKSGGNSDQSPLQLFNLADHHAKAAILLHPLAGFALGFKPWLPLLDNADVIVYEQKSLQHVHQSIEELAAFYVDLLKQSPAVGKDLCIIGWSMGGAIAIEMAELLMKQGLNVDRVLILDSAIGALSKVSMDDNFVKSLAMVELGPLAAEDPVRVAIFEANLAAFANYKKECVPECLSEKASFYLATENPLANMSRSWLAQSFGGNVIEICATHNSIINDATVLNEIIKINSGHQAETSEIPSGVTV